MYDFIYVHYKGITDVQLSSYFPFYIFMQNGFNIFDSSVIFSSIKPKFAFSSKITDTITNPIFDCNIIEFDVHVNEYFEEPRPSLVACVKDQKYKKVI